MNLKNYFFKKPETLQTKKVKIESQIHNPKKTNHSQISQIINEISNQKNANSIYTNNDNHKKDALASRSKTLFEKQKQLIYSPYVEIDKDLKDFPFLIEPRDKDGNSILSVEWDPTTLQVPNNFLATQTPTSKEWWKFKSQHFDKVIFYKLGKFYELFYTDAFIGHMELNLNWMGDGKKMHVGFPEKVLEPKMDILVNKGFKVVVVEQYEYGKKLNNSLSVERNVHQIVSKGIYYNYTGDSSLCDTVNVAFISYSCSNNSIVFGIYNYVKTSLSLCFVQDEDEYNLLEQLKKFLLYIKPVEIVVDSKMNNPIIIEMISNMPNRAIISKTKIRDYLAFLTIGQEISNLTENCELKLILDDSNEDVLKSIILMKTYFENNMLLNDFLNSYFEYYTNSNDFIHSNTTISRMNIDTSTLKQLEILGDKPISLNNYFNGSFTNEGNRITQFEISHPLTDLNLIHSRQNVFKYLYSNSELLQQLKNILNLSKNEINKSTLLQGRIMKFKSNGLNQKEPCLFENIVLKRINIIKEYYNTIQKVNIILDKLNSISNQYNDIPAQLIKLLSVTDGKNLSEINADIDQHIIWTDDGNGVPRLENYPDYAEYLERYSNVDQKFDFLINSIRNDFNVNVQYVNAKYEYEIELNSNQERVVEEIIKKYGGYRSSNTKEYVRYHSDTIQNLVHEKNKIEIEMNDQFMMPWLRTIGSGIAKHFSAVKKVISSIGYLDFYQNVTYKFLNQNDSDYPICMPDYVEHGVHLSDCWHISLKNQNNSSKFVKNDIDMTSSKCMLLSGPNMGGKSTLMRQIASVAILSQMGCFVPCSAAHLPVFSSIFSRIGSSDDLLKSKSTFLLECEEVKHVVAYADRNSLCLVDEFGRGTSTFDGTAIAKSVLDYMLSTVCPYMLFSSHYRSLIEMYSTDDRVLKRFMGYECADQQVKFTFKICEGITDKSYATNVARKANLNESIILNAEKYILKFEKMIKSN